MMKNLRLILAIAPIALLMACGNASDSKTNSTATVEKPKSEAGADASKTGELEPLGSLGLKTSQPFKFSPTTLDIDDATKALIEKQENYSHETNDDEAVMISVVKYKDEVELDLKGAKEGAVDAMVKYLSGTTISEKEETTERDGMKIIKYISEQEKTAMGNIVLKTAFFEKGKKLVQVIAIYKKENEDIISGKVDHMINTVMID